MKIKSLDLINISAIILTLVGVVLEVVGGEVLSVPISVGINTNLSPVLFVGIAVIVISLAVSIVGSAITESRNLNKPVSAVAIYLSVIAVMFAIVYLVLTIVMPVFNPANG